MEPRTLGAASRPRACPLPTAFFSLSASHRPSPPASWGQAGGDQTRGLLGSRKLETGPLMRPGTAALRPPAFQSPVPGYCARILNLFVHLSGGPPAPQPPCGCLSSVGRRPRPADKRSRARSGGRAAIGAVASSGVPWCSRPDSGIWGLWVKHSTSPAAHRSAACWWGPYRPRAHRGFVLAPLLSPREAAKRLNRRRPLASGTAVASTASPASFLGQSGEGLGVSWADGGVLEGSGAP